jgi:hypothetical protein
MLILKSTIHRTTARTQPSRTIMPPKKMKDQPPACRNSKAKKLLEEDVKSGSISLGHDMDPEDVYLQ